MAEGEGKEVKERRRREKAKKLKRQGSPLLYENVLILWKKSRIPTTLLFHAFSVSQLQLFPKYINH
jgi:hypothetical protein